MSEVAATRNASPNESSVTDDARAARGDGHRGVDQRHGLFRHPHAQRRVGMGLKLAVRQRAGDVANQPVDLQGTTRIAPAGPRFSSLTKLRPGRMSLSGPTEVSKSSPRGLVEGCEEDRAGRRREFSSRQHQAQPIFRKAR